MEISRSTAREDRTNRSAVTILPGAIFLTKK